MFYPRLQLINKRNRLNGMDDSMIGEYVKADEWSILERIGPQLDDVVILSAKKKAISIDYINKKIYTNYDSDSSMFKKIKEQNNKAYNKDVGNHWGIDLLLTYSDSLLTWFFCTPTMREQLPSMVKLIGCRINIKAKPMGNSYTFYTPLIQHNSLDLWPDYGLYKDVINEWKSQ